MSDYLMITYGIIGLFCVMGFLIWIGNMNQRDQYGGY